MKYSLLSAITLSELHYKLENILAFDITKVLDNTFWLLLTLCAVSLTYSIKSKNRYIHSFTVIIVGILFIHLGNNFENEKYVNALEPMDITYEDKLKYVNNRNVELQMWNRLLDNYLKGKEVQNSFDVYYITYKNPRNIEVSFEDFSGVTHTVKAKNIGKSPTKDTFVSYSILDENITYEYSKGKVVNVTVNVPNPEYYLNEEYKKIGNELFK